MSLSSIFRRPSASRISRHRESAARLGLETLSREQSIDVWEHAALLYRVYEWQAAAETFEFLSKRAGDRTQRALCLLNAGMIRARLGDHDLSISRCEETGKLVPTLLLTHFLIALVSCSRSDYSRAESSFEACLYGFSQNDSLDYGSMGLDFMLNRHLLEENLEEVHKAKLRTVAFGTSEPAIVCLHSIPAENIFEAPPRSSQTLFVSERHPRQQAKAQIPSDTVPIDNSFSGDIPDNGHHTNSSDSQYGSDESRSPQSPLQTYASGLSDIPDRGNDVSGCYSTTQDSRSLSSSNSSVRSSELQTWRRRPSTPYTPRDARGEYESVMELARFIQQADQAKSSNSLIPKDAKGEYESVGELARFVQIYAPDTASDTDEHPFSIDSRLIADLTWERILNGENEEVVSTSTPNVFLEGEHNGKVVYAHEATVDSERSLQQRSASADTHNIRYRNTSGESSTSTPRFLARPDPHSPLAKISRDRTLETLPPAVCQPLMRRSRPKSSGRVGIPNTVRQAKNVGSSPSSTSTASSIYRGLTSFERRVMARENTLRALEGGIPSPIRPKDKPLPPHPISR